MANETLTKLEELQAQCAILAPVFLEYLRSKGTAINEIEVATALDGITTLPGRYNLGGVEKNVLVPLDLLTLDVRERIEEVKHATVNANVAADNANNAADKANAAADRVDESILDLSREKLAVLEAAQKADESAGRATTAAERANAAADYVDVKLSEVDVAERQRQANEQERQRTETARNTAELSREEAERLREQAKEQWQKYLDNLKDELASYLTAEDLKGYAKTADVTHTLTLQRNGVNVKQYNGTADVTANIEVPTKISELSNDLGFVTSTALGSYVTQNAADAAYVKLDSTAQDIYGDKTFRSNWKIYGGESSHIYNKRFPNSTYKIGGTVTDLHALINSLAFQWYDDVWVIGNIRSLSKPTYGFGIGLVSADGSYVDGYLTITSSSMQFGGNTVLHSGNWSNFITSVGGGNQDLSRYLREYRVAAGTNIDTLSNNAPFIVEVNKPTGTLPSSGMATSWMHLFNWGNVDTSVVNGYGTQMASNYVGAGNLYYRQYNDQKLTAWKTILDSSNYTSYINPANFVKKSGDTMTGNLTVPRININANGSDGYISATAQAVLLLNLAGINMLCLNSERKSVQAADSTKETISCGHPLGRWSNVYSVLGDFSGAVTAKEINIVGTANGNGKISSDSADNIWIQSKGIIPFVINGADKVIRPSTSLGGQIDLGTSAYTWKGIYAATGDFNGASLIVRSKTDDRYTYCNGGSMIVRVPSNNGYAGGLTWTTNDGTKSLGTFGAYWDNKNQKIARFFLGGEYDNPLVTLSPDGNFGIGVGATDALRKLHVKSSQTVPLLVDTTDANENAIFVAMNGTTKSAFGYLINKGTYMWNATAKAYLGISDTGTPFFAGNTLLHTGNIGASLTSYGRYAVAGTWTAYQDFAGGAGNSGSDMRFKVNVKPLQSVLSQLLSLEFISYIWNKQGESQKDTFGLKADQLMGFGGIFRKMVHERNDNEKTKWVEYDRTGVLALKGLQELHQIIKAQQREIEYLKSKVR